MVVEEVSKEGKGSSFILVSTSPDWSVLGVTPGGCSNSSAIWAKPVLKFRVLGGSEGENKQRFCLFSLRGFKSRK